MLIRVDWPALGSALALTLCLAATPAQAYDAEAGRQLARQWCANCHTVEGRNASDQAPPLEAIAKKPSSTPKHLRAWLSTSHTNMPDLSLSKREIDAIIAYLDQLKDK